MKVVVNAEGRVIEAEVARVEGKRAVLMSDESYEQLARQWRFHSTEGPEELEIHFVYQLMPAETRLYELGTTFELPATVVVRGAAVLPEPTTDYTVPR